jgi:SAM-dependent methyltransferase
VPSEVSYPEHGNETCYQLEDGSFWFAHRNQCILEVLKRHPPGGRFFEIGAGNGFVAAAVQGAGWPVTAIEPGPKGAEHARERGIEQVICARFEDCELPAAGVPAAGAFDVLEHIEDAAGFLRSVSVALTPGGRLYVSVPALSALWSQEDVDAGHFRRYSTASLRRALVDGGFVVEYCTYFFCLLPLPILMARSLPYRLSIRRNVDQAQAAEASQHCAPGIAGRFLRRLLRMELAAIRAGWAMPAGSSVLAVAQKR